MDFFYIFKSAKLITMTTHLLILSGLGDSGEKHWQTYWQKLYPKTTKVIHQDWQSPQLNDWLENLSQTIEKLREPTIIVAHSLAVSLVLHWSKSYTSKNIIGALLVAPADVDSTQHTPECIRNFAPMPMQKLPFSSIVVASENDPFASFERKKIFAKSWGSEFVSIGHKGHINSDSNLEFWEEGQQILEKLIATLTN